MIYNKTSQKLKTPQVANPPDKWVRATEAFDGIIGREQFEQAQQIIEDRKKRYDPDYMLRQLESIYQQHDFMRSSLVRSAPDTPSASTYASQFGSLDFAVQQLFEKQHEQTREIVQERIRQQVPDVLNHSDFLVLDQKLTIAVQPAVPIANGYDFYWPFQRDARKVIDITLGVMLSATTNAEILGYIALPRWLTNDRAFRLPHREVHPRIHPLGGTGRRKVDSRGGVRRLPHQIRYPGRVDRRLPDSKRIDGRLRRRHRHHNELWPGPPNYHRASREKTKSNGNKQYTVVQLRQDIAETTRVKTSYVREAKTKENRFMTLFHAAVRHFGDWPSAVKAAGFQPRQRNKSSHGKIASTMRNSGKTVLLNPT